MKLVLFLVAGLFAALQVRSQLQLPGVFGDNMVLQRDRPVHFWGKGIPGDTISVRFSGETRRIVVMLDSTWSVFFVKRRANSIPQAITIQSGDRIVVLKNVLIGDIWICSGQSNMEFPFAKEEHAGQEYASAFQPLIRLCNPPPAGRNVYGVPYTDSLLRRLNKDRFYGWNGWEVCDSSTVKPMSAVAYYFAKQLVQWTNIPIGIINLSIGGAPIETFISSSAMRADPLFARKVKEGNWLDDETIPAWVRERGRQNTEAGYFYGDNRGPDHAYKPGFAFRCGIELLLPMPIKGMIWYQGESNSLEKDRMMEYRALMHLMINDYRAKWGMPEMPFYWVQLSSIDTTNYQSHYWPAFRNEQRLLLTEISHGGMAVCTDIGAKTNVHPTNKKEVGERLARWALYQDYHISLTPSGPLPASARYVHGKLVIRFRYGNGLQTSDGGPLRGFSLDSTGKANAEIQDQTVRIPVAGKPRFVYYGWQSFTDANLVNDDLLPASTFKIEVQ